MLKLTKKILLYLGSSLLLVLILFEIYYYQSKIWWRLLTDGEMWLLKTIYATGINYDKVRIFDHKFAPKFIQADTMAIAPNGWIYFPKGNYSLDFSQEDVATQRWLVHEMMHVYQYQHLWQVMFWKAWYLALLWLQWQDVYHYTIDFDKKLSDYNLEQQWDIVADYFLWKQRWLELSDEEVKWYERIISNL